MALDEENESAVRKKHSNDEGGNDGEQNIHEQERLELETFIKEQRSKIEARVCLREQNMNCERPDERFFVKLDASLKKNTAFVKKMKQFTTSQLDAFLKDMRGLNLSKYISEICSALSEAKLKMNDVPAVVTLCSKLHQTYVDFDAQFLEAWQKILPVKQTDKICNASKMRVDLRLFAELVSCGVINTKQGLQMLGSTIVNIIGQDKEGNSFFPIILSFCRHCGEEYAGLIPRRMLRLSEKYGGIEIPKSDFLPADKQQNLRSLLKDYFKIICKHLTKEREELMNMTRNVRHTIESKGEISNDKKEKCELMQANFDKLYTSAQTLSDLVNEPLPDFAKETEICNPGTVIENILEDTTIGEMDPWGDEETKSFYTDLPDLRQFLPNFSAPKIDLEQIEEPTEMTEEALDAEIDAEIDLDDPPSNTSDPPNDKDIDCDDNTHLKIGNALMAAGRLNSGGITVNKKQQFDVFLNNLNNCVNKELIDSAAIEFLLNYNTKNNRKKLTKSIFAVQRTRLDLLPFLSRFVAIVNLCNTDVAMDLSEMLRKEFKWHIRMKNQLTIESKIKIVRFIGEMTKFGLCKKFDALGCLKMLLRDFQHHQIEMACAFIEVAGVYLYNCRDSRILTNVFLDQMMRLKTATALDSRHSAQIENVYYLVKPPTSVKQDLKIRPDIHEYIRHLIFEELTKSNVTKCIKLMSRLNWEDPSVNNYAIKCLSKAYLIRYPLIRWLADLVVGLSAYQEEAVIKVIDNVFEDIRAGLEIHSPKLAQRRIAMARYLGELYNYKLLDSTHILNTLYSIISLGVSTEEGSYSEIDPPDSLFRIKLACILLDTCGQYFTGASSNKKLDYFLVFFQHYYWYKKSNPVFNQVGTNGNLFPILVEHTYCDCLNSIRPNLKHYKSLDEAKQAVEKLKEKLYPKLQASFENNQSDADKGLQTVREDSEADDVVSDDSSTQCDGRIRQNNVDRDKRIKESYDDNEEEDEDAHTECTLNPHDQANFTDFSDSEFHTNGFSPRDSEKTKEDLEFEQLFEKMAADSYQERLKESVKANTKDIPVPMTAKVSKKSYEQIANSHSSSSVEARENTHNNQGAVSFTLMVRGGKGGKHQFKQFVAPPDSHLAINLKLQEEKIREEKEKVKRLTLNITERIEEEDYQESLMQNQRTNSQVHFQRPIKPKFKHQKGAPDADLIFN